MHRTMKLPLRTLTRVAPGFAGFGHQNSGSVGRDQGWPPLPTRPRSLGELSETSCFQKRQKREKRPLLHAGVVKPRCGGCCLHGSDRPGSGDGDGPWRTANNADGLSFGVNPELSFLHSAQITSIAVTPDLSDAMGWERSKCIASDKLGFTPKDRCKGEMVREIYRDA